jgi:pimeloyl-ACP methyl ester carboxylesterase
MAGEWRCGLRALFEPTAFHVLPDGDIGRDEIEQVVAVMKWALEGGAPNAAVELFIDYWAGIGAYAALPPHLRRLFAGKVETALQNFGALLDEPATLDDYAKLTMPACLIVGDSSPSSSRRVAERLSRTFACCERHSVDGGHMAPITRPDFVNPIIERFITTVEACPAPWWRIEDTNHASCSAQAA